MLFVYRVFPIEAIHMSASPIAIGSSIELNMQILIMMFLIICSYLFGDVIINVCNDKDNKATTERSAISRPSVFIVLATFIVHLMLLLITLMNIPDTHDWFMTPLGPHIGLLIIAGAALGYHLGLRYLLIVIPINNIDIPLWVF